MKEPVVQFAADLIEYIESSRPGAITQIVAHGGMTDDYCLIRKDDLAALLERLGMELTDQVKAPFVWNPASSNKT